jgi:Cu+-exporting ATPase
VTDDATDEVDVWSMARLVAGGSSHTLARAIIDSCPADATAARATSPARCLASSLPGGHGSDHNGDPTSSGSGWRAGGESADIVVRTLAGRGLSGEVPGMAGPVLMGNTGWMEEQGLTFDDTLRSAVDAWLAGGRALTCIGWDGAARGAFCFDEDWRPSTGRALDECRRLELAPVVLTGDHAERGRAVAEELRLPVLAGLLPTDKVSALAKIKRDQGPVAMVGDGVNDAPALATADVGLALESAADLSRQSADVSLLGDDLSRVPWIIDLSRRTVRVMRQNLFWAFAYNTIGIGLALGGLLNPIWAAAAMVVSSVIVVGNSLRLAPRSELSGGGHA